MTNNIQLLFFASLGERLGCDGETYTYTDESLTLSALKEALAQRSDVWQELIMSTNTRCAVNQSIATDDIALKPNDEVAFFPPVTGG